MPKIGAEFGGYRLESLIGHGGMSIVYRAQHLSLERTVALKLLAPQLSEDEAFRERFLRESRMAAGLDHPNVIPIFEAGEEEGVFFIAMRYVDGLDLKTVLKREGPLPLDRTSSIIGQVANALEAAHAKGLVHRDVKPANILIASRFGQEETDHVYLSDFGVVKHGASRPLTQTGMFVGTAEYASPEQIEGKELDGRADVYALGCVLYECLTGDPAYDKDSEVALMYAHLLEPPPVAGAKRPDLPPEVDVVVAKAMAKARDDRFQSPRELAVALREAIGAPATSAGATQLSPESGSPTVLAGSGAGAPPAEPEPPSTVAPAAPPTPPGEPAAPPAAPTPAPRPPMSRQTKLIIAGAVAAVLVIGGIVGAVIALTGGGSSSTGAGPTTTSTGGAESTLMSVLVPSQIAAACTTQNTPAKGAVETETCTPTAGAPTSFPDELTLSFFPNARTLETAYQNAKKGVTIGNCGNIPGEKRWIHLSTGRTGGRRFCYTKGNESLVVWTHEKLGSDDHVDMLGIAKEPGRAPTVFNWWNSLKDVIGKCRGKAAEDVCLNTIQKLT